MDKLPNLSPHRVRTPIALIAFGVVAMLVLLLFGAPWYVVMGVILIILAVGFLLIIKHPELRMEGEQLYNATRDEFEGFRPDVTQHTPSQLEAHSELDALRIEEYEKNRGLFLSHRWRPSEQQGQVADIIIRLEEHRDTSTRPSLLAQGVVESVRYELLISTQTSKLRSPAV